MTLTTGEGRKGPHRKVWTMVNPWSYYWIIIKFGQKHSWENENRVYINLGSGQKGWDPIGKLMENLLGKKHWTCTCIQDISWHNKPGEWYKPYWPPVIPLLGHLTWSHTPCYPLSTNILHFEPLPWYPRWLPYLPSWKHFLNFYQCNLANSCLKWSWLICWVMWNSRWLPHPLSKNDILKFYWCLILKDLKGRIKNVFRPSHKCCHVYPKSKMNTKVTMHPENSLRTLFTR